MAEIPTPPSAQDIFDKIEFETTLTRLIATNIQVNRWLFKIDDEYKGRGTAQLDIKNMKIIEEMRKKRVEISEAYIDKLQDAIKKILPKKVVLVVDSLYNTWDDQLDDFCNTGGIIEAVPASQVVGHPSLAFLVHPSGQGELVGAYDRTFARPQQASGSLFPQSTLPSVNLEAMVESVTAVLYQKGVIGFCAMDLVAFQDPSKIEGHPLFWAVDLDCHLTDVAASLFFFNFLMDGQLDQITGKYWVDLSQNELPPRGLKTSSTGKQRFSMMVPYVQNPGLCSIQYKTFFHMCRLENISFDLERKMGSVFLLSDSLQGGVIGLVCIGATQKEAVKLMAKALQFIQMQAGAGAKRLLDNKSDECPVDDIISHVKMLNKKFEREENAGRQKIPSI